jgi:hypothetical protein
MNLYFDTESLVPYISFMPTHYYVVAVALVVTYLVIVTVVSESFSKTAVVSTDNKKKSRRQKFWSGTKISTTKYSQIGKEFERRKEPREFRIIDSR